MSSGKVILCLLIIPFCISCHTPEKEAEEFILTDPPPFLNVLEKGGLDICTFYNTTDYYTYKGITKGFHYELAKDFADFLGVKLRITDVTNNIDDAIGKLGNGCDLLAVSFSQLPCRDSSLSYTQPLFYTGEVIVQNNLNPLIKEVKELDGKSIFIQKNTATQKTLQDLQDSLHITINVVELDQYSYEDILHLVETGEIDYSAIDENIAKSNAISMKNLDYSLQIKDSIPISWVFPAKASFLTEEANEWLGQIRKNGKLNTLYKRYFNNHKSVPHHKSKYSVIREGDISPFDALLKKEGQRLEWDWRLLAAIVYIESGFDPEAESQVGAYGLMQLLPETAALFKVNDYTLPDSNVYAGVMYLKYLNDMFVQYPMDSWERIKFTLAAYNAGAGHVLDAMRLAEKYGKDPHKWDDNTGYYLQNKSNPEFYRDPVCRNGYCNGQQTYNYIHRVLETYNNYKNIKP